MSVSEYKTKFSFLLHFALNAIIYDEAKKQKFEDGLAESIRGRVISFQLTCGEELHCLFEKRKGVMEGGELASKKHEAQTLRSKFHAMTERRSVKTT
ncbi:hypothetical protein ACLOJK_013388 [Asimina triloba]